MCTELGVLGSLSLSLVSAIAGVVVFAVAAVSGNGRSDVAEPLAQGIFKFPATDSVAQKSSILSVLSRVRQTLSDANI